MPDEAAETRAEEEEVQSDTRARAILLWSVEFDRKVGVLSVRLQLGLGWRNGWLEEGSVAGEGGDTSDQPWTASINADARWPIIGIAIIMINVKSI